ncbi:MAG TPA: glycogen debranching enzyme N-terminal domain-containing protein, partial [Magnetospirillum sp.]|nr:glycogen debranching enzyme N-terminal domain-containing protein [Magnetospirillum sp.]
MTVPQIVVRAPAQGGPDWQGKEWMLANGLGGYASGTLAGGASRRHDGLLVSALDAPRGRTVMLDGIDETVVADGGAVPLFDWVVEFRLELGLPVWRFQGAGRVIERRMVMPWRQNTVHVLYSLLEGEPVGLVLRPWLHVRHADWGVDQPLLQAAPVDPEDGRVEITLAPWPTLRLGVAGWRGDFTDPQQRQAVY